MALLPVVHFFPQTHDMGKIGEEARDGMEAEAAIKIESLFIK